MDSTSETAESEATRGESRRGRRHVAGVILCGALLLAGGVGIGSTLPDPTESDAYRSLSAEASAAQDERVELAGDYDALAEQYEVLDEDHTALSDSIETREADVSGREGGLDRRAADLEAAEAAVAEREEAITAAEQTKAANTIGDGTWTVGTDVEPGTYRSSANVESSCYWGIYTSGSNGDDIIQNDIPGGGRPVVTLAVGQDFNSTRCGTWDRQP